MDGLEFVASLVASLAWPLVVLIIVLMLRAPLSKLLTSRAIKRLKAGPAGLEIEYWDETLEEAKAELESSFLEHAAPVNVAVEVGGRADDFMEEMRALARISPSAAVMESYTRLERVVREVLEPRLRDAGALSDQEASRKALPMRLLLRRAADIGLITQSELGVVDELALLRNAVAHGAPEQLDTARAIEYAELVRQVIIAILLGLGITAADGLGYI